MSINEFVMSLELGLIYGIVAIGIFIAFQIIDFPDLSCDGSFVLGSATSTILIKAHYHPLIALAVALISGALAGATTTILNSRFKVPNLLSGILVAFMLYSINLRILGGRPNIALIGEKTIFTIVNPTAMLLITGLVVWLTISYVFNTQFGLALRCIGLNKKLALSGGISISSLTLIGLALSNSLIATGGAIFSQHQGFSDVSGGVGTIIVGFASLTIGQHILPSRYVGLQILGCLLGAILYRILISLALHSDILGLSSQDLNLVTGLMIIGIMVLQKKTRGMLVLENIDVSICKGTNLERQVLNQLNLVVAQGEFICF